MLDSEYAYSETMGKLVQKLAFLQKTRESIEDGMNNMESVVKLKEAKTDLKHQIEEIEVVLESECYESVRELNMIDDDIASAKSRILSMWDGEKRTMQYEGVVLSLRGRKSVIILDSGVLLADLMAHFSADRVAEEFVSTFNKKNLKRFMDLYPQDESVAQIEETIYVYLNPSSEQKEV
jgi:hypothetical protein